MLSKPVALVLAATFGFALVAPAQARTHYRVAKVHKTHRILANNKSVRINDAGEVINTRRPASTQGDATQAR